MKDLRLSEIWIYPIKSLGGIRLTSAKVREKGLANDRRWMLVDENGVFMTQRVHPRMALFKLALQDNELQIIKKEPGKQPVSGGFRIDLPPQGESVNTKI